MTTHCTLYSPTLDFAATALVQQHLRGWTLELEGPASAWTQALFRSGEASLALNSLVFAERGDPFSRLQLSTDNYVNRRAPGLSAQERAELTGFIWKCKWIVGVVGTGPVLGQGPMAAAVDALARHLSARIFDGTHLVLPAGSR